MNQIKNMCRYLPVIAAFFLFLSGFSANAAEVIHSFDSHVQVAKDGTLTVTETIKVRAEGRKIRRGIYRDFPLLFEDADGETKQVGFDLISVSRDGKPDGSRVDKSYSYVRVYIGEKDFFLPTGDYTYTIKYMTDRQIRFFENHEEVYWNATGNFWDFPINSATAKVVLPDGVSATETDVFTGRVGSTERAAKISSALDSNVVRFSTSSTLQPGEGMTIAVKVPKGSINPPSSAQQSAWFFQDYRGEIISISGLLIALFYYLISWFRIGRDPQKGVVVPRWDPPQGISPALTSYIYKKGLSGKGWDAIAAAILNLAVKGLVTLEDLSGDLKIQVTGEPRRKKLPVGEAAIFNTVVGSSGTLTIAENHGSKVKRLQNKFQSAMTREHRSDYYKHNVGTIVLGVVISFATIAATLFFGNLTDDEIGYIILSGFACFFIANLLFVLVRGFSRGGSLGKKIAAVAMAGFFGFLFFSGILGAIADVFQFATSPWMLRAVIGLVLLNVLFFFLMGAPTPTGRKLMDEIEGLKQYLNLAEKDRMNLAGAPEMSPQHYETLLPYAVALGLEKPWSKAFEAWLAAAIAAGAVASTYSPGWYSGRNFRPDRIGDSISDISDGMQSSFSSAMPVPKSSSSGFSGGGSSGGGGGGGGGGGW